MGTTQHERATALADAIARELASVNLVENGAALALCELLRETLAAPVAPASRMSRARHG